MTDNERHAGSGPSEPTEPDKSTRGPHCPFCGASDTELLSLFGSQLLTEQYYCRVCHSPFEHIKDDVEPGGMHARRNEAR